LSELRCRVAAFARAWVFPPRHRCPNVPEPTPIRHDCRAMLPASDNRMDINQPPRVTPCRNANTCQSSASYQPPGMTNPTTWNGQSTRPRARWVRQRSLADPLGGPRVERLFRDSDALAGHYEPPVQSTPSEPDRDDAHPICFVLENDVDARFGTEQFPNVVARRRVRSVGHIDGQTSLGSLFRDVDLGLARNGEQFHVIALALHPANGELGVRLSGLAR
jgi:hypothetical protein